MCDSALVCVVVRTYPILSIAKAAAASLLASTEFRYRVVVASRKMLVEWACTACSCCVFAALWCIRVVAFLSSVAWDRWVTGADASVPLPERREGVSRGKIAIVGGGIAGCGAAWALARDGFEVVRFSFFSLL